MKQKSGQLNYVFWVVCILAIIRNITNIAKAFINLLTPESIDFLGKPLYISSHPASLYSILSSFLIICALILTLNKRRLGVWSFFAVQFVSATVSLAFFEEPLKQLPISFGLALIHSAVFFCLLLIRRNGVSSWRVIFSDNDERVLVKEYEKHSLLSDFNNDRNISDNQNIRKEEKENVIGNDDSDVVDNNQVEQVNNNDVEEKPQTESPQDVLQQSSYNKNRIRFHFSKLLKIVGYVILSLALLTGIGYGIWIVYSNNQPDKQYLKANKLFADGKIKDAICIYTKLANEKDYIPAKTRLGELYTMNDSVAPNYKLGIKYLTENAPIDSMALFDLMKIYNPESDLCEGKYASKEKIEYYAKMAIRQNRLLRQSFFLLGNLEMEKGNFEIAYYYWGKSSQYDYYLAFDNLGWMYFNGKGVEENDGKAKYYFEKALSINSDDDFALYHLALMYENGYGVAKDMQKALKLLKKAAELGNDDAKSEVARIQMDKKFIGLWINGEEL